MYRIDIIIFYTKLVIMDTIYFNITFKRKNNLKKKFKLNFTFNSILKIKFKSFEPNSKSSIHFFFCIAK